MFSCSLTWFLLCDSVGQPYKGTSSDAAPLPDGAIVAQLRDAVKYKHSNKLAYIDAADLIVYANKTAFENKEDEPLKSSWPLEVLGKSEEEALFVIVPLFPPCRIPFFQNLINAPESNGWISLGGKDFIPSTSLNKLFIRQCFRTIASSIRSGINKAIVTGTPGIGKYSSFTSYGNW